MLRRFAIALPLLAVAGCGGGSDSTQGAPVATEPATATVLDASSSTDAVATEPESTDIDTTPPPDATATTEAVVVEGADSSEDAVSEWFDGLATSDLSRMWSTIDPGLRTEIRRAAWDACIATGFPERSDVSIVYDEAEVYPEDGSVFSTGSVTVDGDFEVVTLPVTFEVVEREGRWFTVGREASEDDESCLARSSG